MCVSYNLSVSFETLQFPLMLGDGEVSQAHWARLPKTEQQLVAELKARGFAPRFWESYAQIRQRGYECRHAAVGAWLAIGNRSRGKTATQEQMGEMLGYSRRQVQRIAGELGALVNEIRMQWWQDRIPDVDDATYHAATGMDGTAADRKLAYQRARVSLAGEDAEPVEDWRTVLEQAKAEREASNASD